MPENAEAARSALVIDCQFMIQMLVEKLHMDKEVVHKIITKDLG